MSQLTNILIAFLATVGLTYFWYSKIGYYPDSARALVSNLLKRLPKVKIAIVPFYVRDIETNTDKKVYKEMDIEHWARFILFDCMFCFSYWSSFMVLCYLGAGVFDSLLVSLGIAAIIFEYIGKNWQRVNHD